MNLDEIDNFDWNIGIVVGGSGSGKTTILNQLGENKKIKFHREKSLISNFDWLDPKEASKLLTSMGLSSVPTWLRPFHLLSNGEQYRATMAYLVGSAKEGETIFVDEFTSVVNRDVAKAMSNSIQKYIRRTDKKIVLASCHYDIMDWLQPDWVYSPTNGKLEKKSNGKDNQLNYESVESNLKLGTSSKSIIIYLKVLTNHIYIYCLNGIIFLLQ